MKQVPHNQEQLESLHVLFQLEDRATYIQKLIPMVNTDAAGVIA